MIEYVVPAPAVACTTQAPVTEHVAPSPTVSYSTPAPVTKYVTPTPNDFFAAPARAIEYLAPAPVIGHIAGPPAVFFLRRVNSYLPKPWQLSPLMPALTPPVL